ncbi:invasin [Salmonella enterica subsp. enterica]|uniref:Invasin n=1 Tax=Salmonella enterica I TaxID=59201 RepID=A0A447U267_SALET|nr:invasin [Salmonella enterica subsp. enterica]
MISTRKCACRFTQHINTSVSLEQYFGDSVDLFDSGNGVSQSCRV